MSTEIEKNNLRERFMTYREQNPQSRNFDVASALEVSEAAILTLDLGKSVIRLKGPVMKILERLEQGGTMMGLTRNHVVVHEVHGRYGAGSFHGRLGSYSEGIDLRLHLDHWHEAYAVLLDKGTTKLPGIQFFNGNGNAVHKAYFIEGSDHAIFEDIVNSCTSDDQMNVFMPVQPHSTGFGGSNLKRKLNDEEHKAFLEDLESMKHVHHFNSLLKRHNLSRMSAIREIEGQYAKRLTDSSVRTVLQEIRRREIEVMFFVGNTGAIQIYSGRIAKLSAMGEWYNILDPEFNLHMREGEFAEIWSVYKPTGYGGVNSIEFYDRQERIVLQIFGKRLEGEAENPRWRELTKLLT